MSLKNKQNQIPFATIKRIMKDHTDCLISDEAAVRMVEETIEFIIKITEYSADITKSYNKKVIQKETIKLACKHLK